jgi:CRISPR/Cas system-associated protein Csm6
MDRRAWMSMFLLSVSFNVAAIGVVAFGLRARAQAQASEAGSDVRPRLELRLDVAQQDMFDRVRKTFDDERGRQETRINSVRDGLVRELVADQPDSSRINSLLDQMALGQSQLQRSLVDRILQEGAILRPDQRAVFARLLERRLLRVGTPRSGDTRGSSTLTPQEIK